MFVFEKIVLLFYERWKYFLGAYMLGYLISLAQTGVPRAVYLVPLKGLGILFGWAIGNAFYKQDQEMKKNGRGKIPIYLYSWNGIKYGSSAILLLLIYRMTIGIIGAIFQFDATPFLW
jgi:hypothetical protein